MLREESKKRKTDGEKQKKMRSGEENFFPTELGGQKIL